MFANFIAEQCHATSVYVILNGAEPNHIPFSAAYSHTDPVQYVIEDGNGIHKCGGIGTYNINNTITRNDSWTWNGIIYNDAPTGNLTLSLNTHVIRVAPLTSNINNWEEAFNHAELITGNPHGVTKADVGLGNVDNTSDADKPLTTKIQVALNTKPNKASAETITGNWGFTGGATFFGTPGKTVAFIGDPVNASATFSFTGVANFEGIADFKSDVKFRASMGTLQFEGNPTWYGDANYDGEIVFNNRYFYSYLSLAQTISDSPTYTVLPFDNDVRSDALYSNTAGVITINSDGWYKISYTGTADNLQIGKNDRWTVNFRIEVNTGSGFSKLVGSDTYSYHRNSEDGKNSVTTTVFVNLTAGNKLRVSAATVSIPPNSGDVVTVANACSISIERV